MPVFLRWRAHARVEGLRKWPRSLAASSCADEAACSRLVIGALPFFGGLQCVAGYCFGEVRVGWLKGCKWGRRIERNADCIVKLYVELVWSKLKR